jgi:hypothetical protein
MVAELFPLAAGLVVGALLAKPSRGWALRVLAAIAIGVCATVISGEWRKGWEFLLVDIPEALLASLLGAAVVRWATGSTGRARLR